MDIRIYITSSKQSNSGLLTSYWKCKRGIELNWIESIQKTDMNSHENKNKNKREELKM